MWPFTPLSTSVAGVWAGSIATSVWGTRGALRNTLAGSTPITKANDAQEIATPRKGRRAMAGRNHKPRSAPPANAVQNRSGGCGMIALPTRTEGGGRRNALRG